LADRPLNLSADQKWPQYIIRVYCKSAIWLNMTCQAGVYLLDGHFSQTKKI